PIFLYHTFSVFYYSPAHTALHSFPTRRSSDLRTPAGSLREARRSSTRPTIDFCHSIPRAWRRKAATPAREERSGRANPVWLARRDRKSTRLNSSHQIISYAVFCLKKKKTTTKN